MRYFIFSLLLLAAAPSFSQTGTKDFTLEDIFQRYIFRVASVPGFNGMADGRQYTRFEGNELKSYDLATGKETGLVFSNETGLKIDDYAFSKDERKLLIYTEGENIYRHSVLYRVYIYDRGKKELTPLDTAKVLHATFNPAADKVAFVKDNNLYYRDLNKGATVAVTTDGKRNEIINGNCDWVYEEEFSFTRAYEWSPNGNYLAYYRFDERQVPEFTMTIYDSLYPTPYKYKYPKAGDPNSIVQIKIFELNNGKTTMADVGAETDQYIPRIRWTPGNQLFVFRMNRLQNKLEYLLTSAATGKSNVIYTETNPSYIEIDDNLTFLENESAFVFTSEKDGWNHVYYYNWDTRKEQLLTPGDFDVATITGVDVKKGRVYYTAAKTTPTQRELYSVGIKGGKTQKLTQEDGMHRITPIAGLNYFLDQYSTHTEPPVFQLIDAKGKVVRVLEDNKKLRNQMKDYRWGKTEFTQLKGSGNDVFNAWIIYPPDFDKNKKYPVLMYQYSGPNSQQVLDQFPVGYYWWHQLLARKGYLIVCTDPTGTGMRGEAFRKKTYLQLGKYESEALIDVARNLGELSFVDKNRIGIWGWSYGGFMSATCLFKGHEVFKAAVAVAPVTNWRYYDNIYTERYMRTPQENPGGYDDNSPMYMANQLTGKFLLIHGTADDNVHFQNSVMLVDKLVAANKEFEAEYYPNRNHGIGGGNARYHLFRRVTKFIEESL